jgi:DNA-binding GntR family transcriptional regulator
MGRLNWPRSRLTQISPYFHLLHASGNYFKANEQHELMLDGLRARDRSAVRLGIRNDIEAASRILAQLLAADIGVSDAS